VKGFIEALFLDLDGFSGVRYTTVVTIYFFTAMSIAVIRTGGKQFVVKPGLKIKVEKLNVADGATVTFDTLLVADEKGTGFDLGTPMTKSKIEGIVKETKKGKKIMVVKYKAKTRYKKNTGHRQFASTVEVAKF